MRLGSRFHYKQGDTNMMIRILGLVCCVVVLCGCSKSATEQTSKTTSGSTATEAPKEAPKLDVKGVLLQPGLAALLVAYPNPTQVGDWMAMVTLKGDRDTEALPRIPLAGSHSVTVLNIQPGEYVIDAKAWVRKYPPYAGVESKPINLVAGELLLMRGTPIFDKNGSLEGVELIEAGRTAWGLTTPPELTKYIAKNADIARG